jgi:hypothetical protein
LTAASRRSLGSVSVPVSRVMLSHPVPVVALVSRYLTNKLIGHRPLLRCIAALSENGFCPLTNIGNYSRFRGVMPVPRVGYQCVTLPFAMVVLLRPFDLHALDTPPAFILSQDQTLKKFLLGLLCQVKINLQI